MTIRLELGRAREAPEGNPRHGYEFVAPLNRYGHLDAMVCGTEKEKCVVRSFRPGRTDRKGLLRRVGRGWRFDYHPDHKEYDEPFFKLDRNVIAPGFYVTITEDDGEQYPFRVVAVTRLKVPA
jgi:hypothetical protein